MTVVPLLAQSAFEPEVIDILAAAFEGAWATIEKSGSWHRRATSGWRRKLWPSALSRRVERDRQRLSDDAVTYLTQSYK